MEPFEAEQIIASYSLGEDPFATLPPAAPVLVRRGLVPRHLMERICRFRALTFVGTKEHQFEDGYDIAYLVLTPAR